MGLKRGLWRGEAAPGVGVDGREPGCRIATLSSDVVDTSPPTGVAGRLTGVAGRLLGVPEVALMDRSTAAAGGSVKEAALRGEAGDPSEVDRDKPPAGLNLETDSG
mmetsp:Transcript_111406/g.347262  ORF Transcript_111406/g.347262 Transcript_111406/m.347262 type:complete len:106 (+) Transcript_111406:201-518(+)